MNAKRFFTFTVVFALTLSASSVTAQSPSALASAQPSNTSKAKISTDTCDSLAADSISTNPISAVGHGAMLNAEGEKIDVTPEFILEAQRYYLRSLFHQADEKQRTKFRKMQKHLLKGKDCDEEVLIHVNSVLIAWLIDKVKPENASGLASINTFLRHEFATDSDNDSQATLEQEGATLSSATNLSGMAYINECRAAGVPIPPDWGSSQWRSKGVLTPNFLEGEAEVFTFESSSPRGICFALPRYGGDSIAALGIICQGSDTSKACFWDNQVNDINVAFPRGTTKPLTEFAGGAELHRGQGGVCTECHAGENPFIVHPRSALDQGAILKPNNWHEPLVHAFWPQNPGPTHVLDNIAPVGGACLLCHNQSIAGRFPEVSRELQGYCIFVLQKAISLTMPPFPSHSNALLAACDNPVGILASNNMIILRGNSPAESFTPCFGAGSECPRKKTLTFTLSERAEVFVRYDLGQSHGCCTDHMAGLLRILLDGTEIQRDQIPFLNYGVPPFDLEDFDYFFSDNVVEGYNRPVSQFDPTRVGPRLENYKIVNRFSLGFLVAGSHTVELQVGDAGWNSTFEIFR